MTDTDVALPRGHSRDVAPVSGDGLAAHLGRLSRARSPTPLGELRTALPGRVLTAPEDVAAYCGDGTGLTGGAVAYPDRLVMSLAAMDRIIGVDPVNRLADV